jgi:DNA-binding cell septation regulator SpoVG
MPSEKRKNGEYADLAFPINAATRKVIEDVVIGEYLKPARENIRKAG